MWVRGLLLLFVVALGLEVCCPLAAQEQADFTWVPSAPEEGQTVLFQVSGVTRVDEVVWDFGGPGCQALPQHQACTPTIYHDCMEQAFEFATDGAKLVSMTVTADGVQLPTMTRQIRVRATGACPDVIFDDDFESGDASAWGEAETGGD